jgi:hypothetical protein
MMDETPILCMVGGVPLKAKPAILANFLGLWGLMAWRAGRYRPQRSLWHRLAFGALSTLALFAADIGHALAHIVSARHAGAPMDEILLSQGMPRTLYHDDNVPPRAHRLRALGGPVYSALGLALSALLRWLAPRDSSLHELAGWSCLGHGLILSGSLVPLPIVDGGTILKWTLVERGATPQEADRTIRRVNGALGVAATGAGLALAIAPGPEQRQTLRRWLPVAGLLTAGAIGFAAALDKIR